LGEGKAMFTHFRGRYRYARRRAVVAVQVAVLMVALLGFAALTFDLGALYNTRSDLQRSADAAALAAAAKLSEYADGNAVNLARQAAVDYVDHNPVFGRRLSLDPAADVTFGRATYNRATQQYDFAPTDVVPDAVHVRLRHTEGSPNGPVPLYFARIFGMMTTELSTEAMAVMMPRDIAIVADLSGSHNDDSEFRNYQSTDINLWNVWDSLPGGAGEIGASWDIGSFPPGWVEADGSTPQAAGPAWGYFHKLGYGTNPIASTYNPTTDAGLVRLIYNQNWSNAELSTYIAARGYSAAEVSAIMNKQYDPSGAYPFRVAVALGLAYWNSGIAGGLWQTRGAPAGNANTWISASELEWTEPIMGRSLADSSNIWLDYINNYVNKTNTEMYDANSNLRYRFGVKTFVNYLMEKRSSHALTPEFASTPTQPMQAVKEAVAYMMDQIDALDTDDQVSLEIYGTTAHHEMDLTHNHQMVSDRLTVMQSNHYDSWTNVGGGVQKGIDELTSSRARGSSRKVMVLLTDGKANVNASGGTNDEPGGAAYAVDRVNAAIALGIRVFAVSVGAESDQSLMQQLADIAQGEHFHAEGSIEEYSGQLSDIFGRLAGTRAVQLIR